MKEDFVEAALRHFEDAKRLARAKRFDNAGYHLGLATECALKSSIKKPVGKKHHGHIPYLFDWIDSRGGRPAIKPKQWVKSYSKYFTDWCIHMRYRSTGHISQTEYRKWFKAAEKALDIMEIR